MSHAKKNYIWIHVRDYRYVTLFLGVFFLFTIYWQEGNMINIWFRTLLLVFFFNSGMRIINFTFLFICFIRQIWWNCWYSKKKDMKNVLKKKEWFIHDSTYFHDFFYKSLPQVYQHMLQHCRLLQSSCAYKINTHCNSSKHHGQTF